MEIAAENISPIEYSKDVYVDLIKTLKASQDRDKDIKIFFLYKKLSSIYQDINDISSAEKYNQEAEATLHFCWLLKGLPANVKEEDFNKQFESIDVKNMHFSLFLTKKY